MKHLLKSLLLGLCSIGYAQSSQQVRLAALNGSVFNYANINGAGALLTAGGTATPTPVSGYVPVVALSALNTTTGSFEYLHIDSNGNLLVSGTGSGGVPNVNGITAAVIIAGAGVSTVGNTITIAGGSSTNGAQTRPALNGGTGTGLNLMAGWNNASNDSNWAQTFPASSPQGTNGNPPLIGICTSNCGTTGYGTFQYQGAVQWKCDNQVVVGNEVLPSSTADGQCHDPVGLGFQQVNENPEANSFVGFVLVANSGAGTLATIVITPHTGYVGNTQGQGFTMSSLGSPFTTVSHWTQRSLLASGAAGHAGALFGSAPIDLGNAAGAGFCTVDNGNLGRGVSGRDAGIDCLTNGYGSPPTESFYFKASNYTIPTALTCTGTVGIIVTQTTGVYSCTLTGNTTFSTPTTDNIGHEIIFDLKQAAGSAFTVAWPGNFVNAPTMTATASASTVAKFYYDGTNYLCTGGCATGVTGTSPIVVSGSAISCPTCSTGSVSPLYLNWTFNSGVVATDASPRFLASHAASIANCYALTTASDGATALTFNIFDNGSTIFSGGAQTIAAATAAGTLTSLGSLATTAIANNDKFSVNITSGTSSWIFTVACK